MQVDKRFSAALSSSVSLFLKVNDLKSTTTFNETMFFYQVQSNIKTPKNVFPVMYNYTNTQSGSIENITISTESTTIPASPSPFLTKYILDTTIQSILGQCDKV